MRHRFAVIALVVVILDLLTKYQVAAALRPGQYIEVIPGFFRISHLLNSGVAFGLFADHTSAWKPYILAAMAVVAVVVIVIYSLRMPPERKFLQAALAMITGGILGNFIDRIVQGSVVDFIELHIQNRFYWPTFNLADSAITVGIVMLLIDTIRHPDQEMQGVGNSEAGR